MIKIGIAIAASYLGIKAPELFLKNKTSKRQKELERAYPNTLDLMLICAESGMSIEHAVRKVSQEIGVESVSMAEEMGLLAAEMSYLADRRVAFENLGLRTGLDSIRSLTTVLVQSEKYGTPLGAALRVLSQESRDHRMTAGGKKGRGVAADPHRADDPVLSARPFRRDPDPGRDSDQPLELGRHARMSAPVGHTRQGQNKIMKFALVGARARRSRRHLHSHRSRQPSCGDRRR